MKTPRPRVLATIALLLAGSLWYLRDPVWLATQTTGLREWRRAADGSRFRWSGGHASFFAPADARHVRIPVSTIFDGRMPQGDEPMLVTFTIDDAPAARVVLTDTSVRQVTLTMPAPGSRRVRRIDVRTSRTREGNHGVMIGDVMASGDGADWRLCCFSQR